LIKQILYTTVVDNGLLSRQEQENERMKEQTAQGLQRKRVHDLSRGKEK
jgi:hypothetical protein